MTTEDKKISTLVRLSPNQKGPKVTKVTEAPTVQTLQKKIKDLEEHIKLSNANKAAETQGLKQLLLQSAEYETGDDEDITKMMEKEKQKSKKSQEY